MISEEEIKHVAWLARIDLSEDETNEFAKQLSSILEYFSRLDELDADVRPTHHVLDLANIFRKDEEGSSRCEALKLAPKHKKRYFKAPKII